MFYRIVLLSSISFLLMGCHSIRTLPRTGNDAYCLVDYKLQTVDCSYNTLEDCTKVYDYQKMVHCWRKSDILRNICNTLESEKN